MTTSSHNPNVSAATEPGKFKKDAPIVYTQTFQGKTFPMSGTYVQRSRLRPGFSVIRVGPGRVSATVPDADLTAAPEVSK